MTPWSLKCLKIIGRPCKSVGVASRETIFNICRLVPELIFQEIEATPSHKIRRQCTSSYHKAQKHIILGSLDGETN